MKSRLVFILVISLTACIGPGKLAPAIEGVHSFTLRVAEIEPPYGVLRIALYNDRDQWLRQPGAVRARLHIVDAATEEIHFYGLPAGSYAIALFHDRNGDNKHNKFWGVVPKESYGFSNNAKGFLGFGLPNFKDASFILPNSNAITINLVKPPI